MTMELSRTDSETARIGESVEVLEAQLTAARDKIANLEIAVASGRIVGAAVGILMADRRCSYDDAFDLLRLESQWTQRKLRDIAEDVVRTGVLEHGPKGRPRN